jgi:hypothetical protein
MPPSIDQPPVPVAKLPLRAKVWAVLCAGVVTLYAAASFLGWDVRASERDEVPSTVRASPGGYRTFHFWHSGYHGGK